jgi:uncharacterized protein GlcG (DUF336 family)
MSACKTFSHQQVRQLLDEVLGPGLHAKRTASLLVPQTGPTLTLITRRKPMKRYAVAALFAASLFTSAPAFAQVEVDGYYLPMKVALKAAETAVASCAAQGCDVTASVVDPAGLVIVELRGDHATVHTKDSSYRKAYTIVSMGPVFGLTLTSQFAALIQKAPNGAGPELTGLPNIFANAGGVAIKHGSEIVGGLGVGGSPRRKPGRGVCCRWRCSHRQRGQIELRAPCFAPGWRRGRTRQSGV